MTNKLKGDGPNEKFDDITKTLRWTSPVGAIYNIVGLIARHVKRKKREKAIRELTKIGEAHIKKMRKFTKKFSEELTGANKSHFEKIHEATKKLIEHQNKKRV
jgi:hypothetical protein